MDQETYDKGMEIRSALLGETYVNQALTEADDFTKIREIFLQVAIYAGVPAAVDSFHITSETFTELDQN